MKSQYYLQKRKNIQACIINFIDEENKNDENLLILKDIFKDQEMLESRDEIIELFHFLTKLANNHHQSASFFTKIEQLISLFKNEITKFLSQTEIFQIFMKNKRILLFLIEQKIFTIDHSMSECMIARGNKKGEYQFYFYKEIKSFIDIEFNIETYFDIKRKIGQNDSYISQLIRNDLIDDFIAYTNQTCQSLSANINSSIYETNSFLIKNEPTTLIEYSAFFGSIQIFKYLYLNQVKLTSSLWIYAIHGRNPEIIHFLEENHIKPKDKTYKGCLIEAIKCHHNEIADYFINNHNLHADDLLSSIFKYYNYNYFHENLENEFILYNACHYDYISLVKLLLKNANLNVNALIIKTF